MLPKFVTNLLKKLVQLIFIIQSVFLLAPFCLIRFFRRIGLRRGRHANPLRNAHPGVFQSEMDIIKVPGFRIQKHQFETEDRAKVVFWRLLADPTKAQTSQQNKEDNEFEVKMQLSTKIPVLLQHGLLDCSLSWFLHNNRETTLPYLLAKLGYDVWVGNNRGTRYSINSSESDQYWNYNIDHLIHYDIPCMIDSILRVTGSQQLAYIGHSQGTMQFLTALDVHPSLQSKIKCFIGLGPLISLKHLQGHTFIRVADKFRVPEIAKLLGFKSIFILPQWMHKLVGILSYNITIFSHLTMMGIKGMCGSNKRGDRINMQLLGLLSTHEPGGGSLSNVHHWIQIYRKGAVSRYDYGKKKNLQIYGVEEPPQYTYSSLKSLPFKSYLFRGTSDRLITENDFKILTDALHPDNTQVHLLEDYAHNDYLWCEDAPNDFYGAIGNILQKQMQMI